MKRSIRSVLSRLLASVLVILTLASLLPGFQPEASAAGTTYIAENAVAYALNVDAHLRQFQAGNQCARYVSACLIAGGINVNQGTPNGLRDALLKIKDADGNKICEELSVTAENVKKIAPGDIIKVGGSHVIIVTSVGKDKLYYCGNNNYRHGEKLGLSVDALKTYAGYWNTTNITILHFHSCQHHFVDAGKCDKCGYVFDYLGTRKETTGIIVANGATLWPMEGPYSAAAKGKNLLLSNGSKLSTEEDLTVTATVKNAYGNTWYEVTTKDGRRAYVYCANTGSAASGQPYFLQGIYISDLKLPKPAYLNSDGYVKTTVDVKATTVHSSHPLKSVTADICKVSYDGGTVTEKVLYHAEKSDIGNTSFKFGSDFDNKLSFSKLKEQYGTYVYVIKVEADPGANASQAEIASCHYEMRFSFIITKKGQYALTLYHNDGTDDKTELFAGTGTQIVLPNLRNSKTITDKQGKTSSSSQLMRDNYEFLGWASSPTATSPEYKAGDTYSIQKANKDTDPKGYTALVSCTNALYAVWGKASSVASAPAPTPKPTPKPSPTPVPRDVTYTVWFDGNDPVNRSNSKVTGSMAMQTYKVGSQYTLPDNQFARAGYTFIGWNTQPDGSGTSYANKASVSNLSQTGGVSIALYAQWKAVDYLNELCTREEVTYLRIAAVGSSDYVMSLPCSNATNEQSSARAKMTDGQEMLATAIWKNSADNYWYAVTVNGITGYFPGNKTRVIGLPADIVTGDTTIPNTLPAGESYNFSGTISSRVKMAGVDGVLIGSNGATQTQTESTPLLRLSIFSSKINKNLGFARLSHGPASLQLFVRLSVPYISENRIAYRNEQIPRAYHQFTMIGTYNVYFDTQGGSSVAAQTKQDLQDLRLPATIPSREGYDFVNWALNPDGSGRRFLPGGILDEDNTTGGDLTLYAQWKRKALFTLSYNANGGTGAPKQQTVKPGGSLTISKAEPVREGYTFLGWADNKNASTAQYQPSSSLTLKADKTIYAVWERNPILSYNANGGSGAPEAQSVKKGGSLTLSSAEPAREGYTFLGWADASDTSSAQYQAGGSLTLTEDKTIYAVWEKKPVLSYDANGGSGAPEAQSVKKGESLTLSSTEPTRDGYTFLGWADASDASSAQYQAGGSLTLDADKTLYAVWEKKPILSYDANGGSGAPEAQSVKKGESLTLSSTEPARDGYTFLGWADASDASSAQYQAGGSLTLNADKTVYAVWEKNPALNYDANGGDGAPESQTVVPGGSVTLSSTEPTRDDYTFLGWADTSDAGSAQYQPGSSLTLNADKTLYAVWEKKPVLSYDANGGSGAPEAQSVKRGESLTLSSTEPIQENYKFLGWAEDPNAAAAQYKPGESLTLTEDKTLYAVWRSKEEKYWFVNQSADPPVGYSAKAGEEFAEDASYDTSELVHVEFVIEPSELAAPFFASDRELVFNVDHQVTGSAPLVKNRLDAYLSSGSYEAYCPVPEADGYIMSVLGELQKDMTVRYPVAVLCLNANGGTVQGKDQLQYVFSPDYPMLSEDWAILGEAEHDKYPFLGWAESADATEPLYSSKDSAPHTGDLTLYAVWDKSADVTLTFDANGGSGAPAQQTLSSGDTVYLPAETLPTRPGYCFLGWAANASATKPDYRALLSSSFTIEQDTVLYAVWDEDNETTCYMVDLLNDSYLPAEGHVWRFKRDGSEFSAIDMVAYDASKLSHVRVAFDFTAGAQSIMNAADYTQMCLIDEFNETTSSTNFRNGEIEMYLTPGAYAIRGFVGEGNITPNVTICDNPGFDGSKPDLIVIRPGSSGQPVDCDYTFHYYCVTYNPNGGTVKEDYERTIDSDGCLRVLGHAYSSDLVSAVRDGYTFLGWSTDPNATTAQYDSHPDFTGCQDDITLYAVWAQDADRVYFAPAPAPGMPPETLRWEDLDGNWGTVKAADYDMNNLYCVPIRFSCPNGPDGAEIQLFYEHWKSSWEYPFQCPLTETEPGVYAGEFYSTPEGYYRSKAVVNDPRVLNEATFGLEFNSEEPIEIQLYSVALDPMGGTIEGLNSGDRGYLIASDLGGPWSNNPEISREGYTFLGWSINADASTVDYEGLNQVPKWENVILYAVWQEDGGSGTGTETGTETGDNNLYLTPVDPTVYAEYGGTAELEVIPHATDMSALTYQWRRFTLDESGNITGAETVPGATGTKLVVANVTGPEEYLCEVYDQYGNSFNIVIRVGLDNRLNVAPAGGSGDISVPYGGRADMTVTVSAGNLTDIQYQWYQMFPQGTYYGSFDSQALSGENSDSLTIENVTEELYFMCEVKDIYGNNENTMFHITVDSSTTPSTDSRIAVGEESGDNEPDLESEAENVPDPAEVPGENGEENPAPAAAGEPQEKDPVSPLPENSRDPATDDPTAVYPDPAAEQSGEETSGKSTVAAEEQPVSPPEQTEEGKPAQTADDAAVAIPEPAREPLTDGEDPAAEE